MEKAVKARVKAAWSVMLYGVETWQMMEKIENILKHCDRRMLRCMAGMRWTDMVCSEEVANRCGLAEIQVRMRQRRLQWFGHVRREKEGGGLRMVEEMIVPGAMPRGRPRRTWRETVERDMKSLGIKEELAMDRAGWKRVISESNPSREGKRDYKRIG